MQDELQSQADAQRAVEVLKAGRRFLLVGHERPDADVLGSQLALARVLAGRGASVEIANPHGPPAYLEFLARPGEFGAYAGGSLSGYDAVVLLDTAELGRTGAMADAIAASPAAKLVFDHHIYEGPVWWHGAYRDLTAAATGVLVARAAKDLGVPLDRDAARALFVSLVSDTGWFRHSNTNAEVLRLAADLVERGAEPSALHAELYQRREAGELHALALQLGRLDYRLDGRLALVDLPLGAGPQGDPPDGDGVLDLARSVEGVELALYLVERTPQHWRLSARSKGRASARRVALDFGGGGHDKAAGASLVGPHTDVRERVLVAAERELGRDPGAGA